MAAPTIRQVRRGLSGAGPAAEELRRSACHGGVPDSAERATALFDEPPGRRVSTTDSFIA